MQSYYASWSRSFQPSGENFALAANNADLAPETTRNTANLWLTKDLGHGFTVGGGANAVGSRFANPGNTVVLPGYVTADAMAAYRTGRYEVQLNINNIGDTRYIVSGHGSSPNLSLPGAPRNVALTLRYSL